jgi:tRNA(Leu) C34 or U34 (ribose-2'-O)-methylase TrmL
MERKLWWRRGLCLSKRLVAVKSSQCNRRDKNQYRAGVQIYTSIAKEINKSLSAFIDKAKEGRIKLSVCSIRQDIIVARVCPSSLGAN